MWSAIHTHIYAYLPKHTDTHIHANGLKEEFLSQYFPLGQSFPRATLTPLMIPPPSITPTLYPIPALPLFHPLSPAAHLHILPFPHPYPLLYTISYTLHPSILPAVLPLPLISFSHLHITLLWYVRGVYRIYHMHITISAFPFPYNPPWQTQI